MALSKKLRFEVFKRDAFTCQYCGNNPPTVVLEIDHVLPVSKGGSDEIHNLVTSCFDCNRGKSGTELNQVPSPFYQHIETVKERERQYKAYKALTDSIEERKMNEVFEVEDIFTKEMNYHFTDKFVVSVKKFISLLPLQEVKDSMHYACSRDLSPEQTIRYFCGVCWGKIKERG
jgi:hypothetical protein